MAPEPRIRQYRPPVDPAEKSAWVGWIKAIWIAVLLVSCYLAGQSMVAHHFFDGGALNGRIENLRY